MFKYETAGLGKYRMGIKIRKAVSNFFVGIYRNTGDYSDYELPAGCSGACHGPIFATCLKKIWGMFCLQPETKSPKEKKIKGDVFGVSNWMDFHVGETQKIYGTISHD